MTLVLTLPALSSYNTRELVYKTVATAQSTPFLESGFCLLGMTFTIQCHTTQHTQQHLLLGYNLTSIIVH